MTVGREKRRAGLRELLHFEPGESPARLEVAEDRLDHLQIGGFIEAMTRPRGLAVRISAVHLCKTHRGVQAGHRSRMVSTAWFGELRTSAALKDEFLRECQGLAGHGG